MDTKFKSYLVKAAYDFCIHHGLEPYVIVFSGGDNVLPPLVGHEKQVTLNLGPDAIRYFRVEDGLMFFSAKFNDEVFRVTVDINQIAWIGVPSKGGYEIFFEVSSMTGRHVGRQEGERPGIGNSRLRLL